MISKCSLFAGVLTGVLLFAVSARSADWPRWRGPHNTGHVPKGVEVPDSLPADPKVLWRLPLGDGVGSPVVAGGRVFVLDKADGKEVLHAVDAVSGKELWQKPVDDAHDDAQGKGPRGTPLVNAGRLYVQSARGEFQCLKPDSGEVIWRKNFVQDFDAVFIGEKPNPIAIGATRHGNTGSPIVDGNLMYIPAGGTNGASVVCVKKETGEVVWKSQNDQAGYGALVIATIQGVKQVIAFTADGVIGLNIKDGALLWRFPIKTTWARHVTTPVVSGDLVMVSSHEHGLYGIRIEKEGEGQKATQAWLTKEAAINFASPVLVGQHLYGLGPARNIICVDIQTGKIAWSKDGYIPTAPSKAHASFIVMGGTIVTLTDAGQLIQIAADPKECREISRAQVAGTNWCNPAYSNGNLYLRDSKNLIAVALKP